MVLQPIIKGPSTQTNASRPPGHHGFVEAPRVDIAAAEQFVLICRGM